MVSGAVGEGHDHLPFVGQRGASLKGHCIISALRLSVEVAQMIRACLPFLDRCGEAALSSTGATSRQPAVAVMGPLCAVASRVPASSFSTGGAGTARSIIGTSSLVTDGHLSLEGELALGQCLFDGLLVA